MSRSHASAAAEAWAIARPAVWRRLTATELSYAASVSPQTTSGHLAKLTQARLLTVVKQGRHRYYRLATPLVAQMMETIMAVAAGSPPRYRPRTPPCRSRRRWRAGDGDRSRLPRRSRGQLLKAEPAAVLPALPRLDRAPPASVGRGRRRDRGAVLRSRMGRTWPQSTGADDHAERAA